MLALLRERYRLALLSDGYLVVQQRKLAALGLAGHFDAVVFSDEWGREAWKPATRPFEAVMQRLGGLRPEAVVYVADNPAKDFLGARNAGWQSIRLRIPGGEHANHEPASVDHSPDYEVNCLVDLQNLLLPEGVSVS